MAYYVISAIALAGFVGWVINIVTLLQATHFEVFEVVQLVGIIAAPLGSVMGWISLFT